MSDDDKTPMATIADYIRAFWPRRRRRALVHQYAALKELHLVLADLGNYCGAYKAPQSDDPNAVMRATGRRDVWLFLQQHLQLTDQDLSDLEREMTHE